MCLFPPGIKISTCVSSDQLWLHLTPPLCKQINTGTSIFFFFFLIKWHTNKLTHKHTSHTQGHTQSTYLHIYNIYIQNPRLPKDRGTTHALQASWFRFYESVIKPPCTLPLIFITKKHHAPAHSPHVLQPRSLWLSILLRTQISSGAEYIYYLKTRVLCDEVKLCLYSSFQ